MEKLTQDHPGPPTRATICILDRRREFNQSFS